MTRQVKTHIRLVIRSVSPSDQSPRCPHEETLGPYLPHREISRSFSAKFAECLREMSRSFSANFCGVSPRKFAEKTLGEISDFYFSPRKKLLRARGVPRRNAKKELLSWADLYGYDGHLGHVTWAIRTNFCSPTPLRLHMKFDFNRLIGFSGKEV